MCSVLRLSMFTYLCCLILFQGAQTRDIGCIWNVTFISMDFTVTHTNLNLNQCICHSFSSNYSGFNYFRLNQTCQSFVNFTTDFEILARPSADFCFLDKPPSSNPRMTTMPTTSNTACPISMTTPSTCVQYLAFRLSTDPCNLISFTQTSNLLDAVGFSAHVTKLTTSFTNTTNDGCSSGGSYKSGGNATGRIALVRRGTCLFYTKCKNAETAGASIVVIYNNIAGNLTASINGTPPVLIPVVSISMSDGARISNAIDASVTSLPTLTVVNVTHNC